MGPLDNPRHELLAQGLAKGQTQQEAFEATGMAGKRAHASRTANLPEVKRRVQELLTDASMMTKIDKAWVMSELQKTYERATESEDYSACNKSLELLGKELGMFVDRHEVDVQLKRKIIVERLTEEDALMLEAIVMKIEGHNAV
jgi:16S rRNA C1402 (ribose-2'-O) methylase RsmI